MFGFLFASRRLPPELVEEFIRNTTWCSCLGVPSHPLAAPSLTLMAAVRLDSVSRTLVHSALVYLAPKTMIGPVRNSSDSGSLWLSFEDLPDNLGCRFSQEWIIIRKHLIQLDGPTRRSGNRDETGDDANSFEASA